MAKESGAKTTPCRNGDLGMQTVISIYVVWSRFGIGSDLGKFRREKGCQISVDLRARIVAIREPVILPFFCHRFGPTVDRK